MNHRPPQLTRNQRELVKSAAASLPRSQRAYFMTDVARSLAGVPSDQAVITAINITLDRMATTEVEVFLCDAAPTKDGSK